MSERTAKGLRIASLPPIMAIPMTLILWPQFPTGHGWQALLFSVAGYAAGLIVSLVGPSTKTERMLYLCYIFSGVLIAFFSRCLHVKSSGHAAGTAGSVSMLVLRVSPWFLLAYLLLIPVYLSSLKLERHARWQMIATIPFGLLGVIGFLSSDALRLGSTWWLMLILCIGIAAVDIWELASKKE